MCMIQYTVGRRSWRLQRTKLAQRHVSKQSVNFGEQLEYGYSYAMCVCVFKLSARISQRGFPPND